jgi:hypothetical protein
MAGFAASGGLAAAECVWISTCRVPLQREEGLPAAQCVWISTYRVPLQRLKGLSAAGAGSCGFELKQLSPHLCMLSRGIQETSATFSWLGWSAAAAGSCGSESSSSRLTCACFPVAYRRRPPLSRGWAGLQQLPGPVVPSQAALASTLHAFPWHTGDPAGCSWLGWSAVGSCGFEVKQLSPHI